jgi:transcriptional regulator with XRE-family HTH domain
MGATDARRIARRVGEELRQARLIAGVSQATAGRAANMSHTQIGRIERGELQGLTVDQVCRASRALGYAASVRLFPVGVPVRDAAHLALLGRFERRLSTSLRLRREVPLPTEGDRRAWDGLVDGGDRPFFVEADTHIHDAQDLDRRIELKLRDDPRANVVVLIVTRSRHNRLVLAEHRESLRGLLPLDGGAILRAIAAGRAPAASGILTI